jgi:hypothetical protein
MSPNEAPAASASGRVPCVERPCAERLQRSFSQDLDAAIVAGAARAHRRRAAKQLAAAESLAAGLRVGEAEIARKIAGALVGLAAEFDAEAQS